MVVPLPARVSHFVSIAACPLCSCTEATRTFYERPFDDPPVAGFIHRYYGGRVPASVLEGEQFRVSYCADCDFYWHARVLDEASMSRFYDDWIDPDASRAKQEARGVKERMHLCSLVARWLEAAKARQPRPTVLDVGGGWGTLGLCARALGCEVYLLETSPTRRRYAERLGLQTVSTLSALTECSVDLAVLNQSLEHIPYPVQLLEAVRRVLRPGGGVAVDVPRADPQHPVVEKGPFQPLEHVNGFTARSLRAALRRAGLDVVPDFSRYAELSARSVVGAAVRNLKLSLLPSSTTARAACLAYFARRPSRS